MNRRIAQLAFKVIAAVVVIVFWTGFVILFSYLVLNMIRF